jgi:hypothetical protein
MADEQCVNCDAGKGMREISFMYSGAITARPARARLESED